uniref:UDP-glucose 4-epimerase n=1 Tax=Proboscia inermis TaxID=420281 RepID=A0A7S0C6C9_9STRA|mmetsp:Transcript_29668/g.29998  ORF Transcript_29668/g.29998 Transcript_29668/m.29998 type:complete len:364 (+) Transcript_29668:142-1233(+)
MTKTVLVTGGCGYIGSHTVVCLLQSPEEYNVVVVDNLCNSSEISLDRVCEIVGLSEEDRKIRLRFYNVDMCDEEKFEKVFLEECAEIKFEACIHFAGLKAVGESVEIPLKYYSNNLISTFNLLSILDKHSLCKNFVFSSSATVYGDADGKMPITEETPAGGRKVSNAYGRTKSMIEDVLADFQKSSKEWSITILRYFNPIGSHPSGLIGEDPNGIPNNLMPYVSQVAVGRRPHLTIFGKDYETHDGTGVRDYIHVVDLAEGHLSAIKYMSKNQTTAENPGQYKVFNLGTGNGYSVLDMVKAMEKACGHELKYVFGERREGDIGVCYADASLAKTELGWSAERDLDVMCADLWRWQSKNPNGFQ